MSTGRPKAVLTVTDDERQKLDQWARRPKSTQRLALRARIVLACAEGRSNTEVARQLRLALPTVGKWRRRFVADRLEGLADEPRPVPHPAGSGHRLVRGREVPSAGSGSNATAAAAATRPDRTAHA